MYSAYINKDYKKIKKLIDELPDKINKIKCLNCKINSHHKEKLLRNYENKNYLLISLFFAIRKADIISFCKLYQMIDKKNLNIIFQLLDEASDSGQINILKLIIDDDFKIYHNFIIKLISVSCYNGHLHS